MIKTKEAIIFALLISFFIYGCSHLKEVEISTRTVPTQLSEELVKENVSVINISQIKEVAKNKTSETQTNLLLNLSSQQPTQQQIKVKKIVEITTAGDISDKIVPRILTINLSDTVVFVNKDFSSHWIASNDHPNHTLYPEKGGCIGSKFDSCVALRPGENWSFTFNFPGKWNYHDHIRPEINGAIVVLNKQSEINY